MLLKGAFDALDEGKTGSITFRSIAYGKMGPKLKERLSDEAMESLTEDPAGEVDEEMWGAFFSGVMEREFKTAPEFKKFMVDCMQGQYTACTVNRLGVAGEYHIIIVQCLRIKVLVVEQRLDSPLMIYWRASNNSTPASTPRCVHAPSLCSTSVCVHRMQGRPGMPQRAMMNNGGGGGGMPNHPALGGGGPPR